MSQKSGVYIRRGIEGSNEILSEQNQFFKYCLFLLTSFLGRLLFITYPLFTLADMRITKAVKNTREFQIITMFEDSNSIKKVWVTFQLYLVKIVLILSSIIILSGITIWLFYLNQTINVMVIFNLENLNNIILIGGLTSIIIAIVLINLFLGPAIYLIQTYDNIGISDVLSYCNLIMTKNTRKKLAHIGFIHLLRLINNIVIYLGLLYIVNRTSSSLLFIFCSITFGMVFLLRIPKILLSNKIAKVTLFQDLMSEYENDLDGTKSIEAKIKKEDLLVTLFNE